MFFFLSKLLPLFVYPLGLACILVFSGLILWHNRPKLATLLQLSAILILWLASTSSVSNSLLRSLERYYLPPNPMPTAEAIVVLGGATRAPIPPRPWIDLQEASDRVVHGAQLYLSGQAPLLVMSGGRVQWDPQAPAIPSEAADMSEFAQLMGVPADAILLEENSFTTHENATNTAQLLAERRINRILLVTSALHMPRAIATFEKTGLEAIAAPTDFLAVDLPGETAWRAQLLNVLPSAESLARTTRAMKEYLGWIVYHLRGWL